MIDIIHAAELWTQRALGLLSLLTLLAALTRMIALSARPIGRSSGPANRLLKLPVLIAATASFIAIGILLWHPIPLSLGSTFRIILLLSGAIILLAGLSLYLWGLYTLGTMFDASSGFAARLHSDHRLITTGPYSLIRNPMYVGVIVGFIGGLLAYRTWTTLVYAFLMFFLPIRARREERLLSQEFAEEWQSYSNTVPGWIPRITRRKRAPNKSLE